MKKKFIFLLITRLFLVLFLFSSLANAQKTPAANAITCGWPPNPIKIAGPLVVTSGCATTSSTPNLACTDATYDFAAVNGQSYTFTYTSCTAGGSDAGICIFSGTTLNAGTCKASALSPGCPNVGNATATLTWVADATANFQVCFFAVSSDCSSKQVETDGSCSSSPGCFGSFSYQNNSAPVSPPSACAAISSPANNSTCRSAAQILNWNAVACASGYYVYFGTDAAATNIQNGLDVGNVTSWDPPGSLTACTRYYWKIVPYNATGTGTCSPTIWTFTVGTAPTAATSASANPNPLCAGGSVTLSTNAGNPQCGSWQWYTGGCGTTSAGSGSSLVVSPTVTTTYYVRAEACNNTICRNITVTVNAAPAVTGQPSNQTVCTGQNAVFTAATSAGSPSYQWQSSPDNATWSNVANGTPAGVTYSGANSASLTANGSSAVALYYYRCVISAGGCSSNSNSATLTINDYPTVAAIGGGAASVMVGNSTPPFTNSTPGGTWSITNGTGSATINGSGVATGTSVGSVTVNYSVTTNGCTTTVTTPLNVTALLPVELLSFEVKCEGAKAVLDWSTSSEKNNDFFAVERSSDAVAWNQIGKINGAGNSSLQVNYEFEDDLELHYSNSNSQVYYRIKQTDLDGTYKYYGPVEINICSADELQLLMQNIFDDTQLSGSVLSKESTDVKIEILDLQGRIIHNEKFSVRKGANSLHVELNGIDKGVYIIKVYNEKSLVMGRFVKM